MITYVRGTLIQAAPHFAVVEAGGFRVCDSLRQNPD